MPESIPVGTSCKVPRPAAAEPPELAALSRLRGKDLQRVRDLYEQPHRILQDRLTHKLLCAQMCERIEAQIAACPPDDPLLPTLRALHTFYQDS